MHFLLNIGNTRVAVLDKTSLTKTPPPIRYFAPGQLVEKWHPKGDWFATAACVVPTVCDALEQAWPGRINFVDANCFPEVDFTAYGSGLGADRMANAAAARALNHSGASLVIDCGTALNTVAVDARGKFRGGVILPGRQTALAALGRQTAQLPEFTAETKKKPLNPLGISTEEGIRNGVDLMSLSAVERLIRETRREPGFANCRVWLTGGDSSFYLQNLPPDLEASEAPLPLTLFGISLAHFS